MSFRVCFVSVFFFYCSSDHRDLHSFPTRRSSDLDAKIELQQGERNLGRRRQPAGDQARIGEGGKHFLRTCGEPATHLGVGDRKSTRLNSSHGYISYAVFCLKKKKHKKSIQKGDTT